MSPQSSSNDSLSHLEETSQSRDMTYLNLTHKRKLAILMLARVAEPLATSSIQSYLFFQLRYFDCSATPAKISAQAGLIFSSKTAAHVSTGMLWGRFADSERGRRKLVLVVGLLSSGVAIMGYGFSKSLGAAVTWQVVDGILNSSIPMIRCMTAELYPEKRHRVRALSMLPLCTSVGMFVGPLLGGFLSTSSTKGEGEGFRERYPYAAPNIAIAAYHFIAAMFVAAGLEEGHESVRSDRTRYFRCLGSRARNQHCIEQRNPEEGDATFAESAPLLPDEPRGMPVAGALHTTEDAPAEARQVRKRLQFRRIWTANVLSTMLAHFIISGHLGTFSNLWAIFLSIPSQGKNVLPWGLSGGLGMDPREIGVTITCLGALSVLGQVLIYPSLQDRFGTIKVWRAALFLFPATYFLAPFSALASRPAPTPTEQAVLYTAVLFLLLLFNLGRTGVTPATSLLINDCTPHPSVRATIHTAGTIVGNLGRSVFPAIVLPVFGFGLTIGVAGLGFWILTALAAVACLVSGRVIEGANGKEITLVE